jgi:tetratricopeptide (TPR) repeat protein
MTQRGRSRWARTLFITIVLTTGIVTSKPLQAQRSIEDRLTEVEAKVTEVEKAQAKIPALEQGNQNNYNFLQIIAAMGVAAGVFLTAAGFREASRIASLRKDFDDRFAAYQKENSQVRDRQEQKNNELINAARGNIEQASELFGALTNMLELQQTATEVRAEIKQLQSGADGQKKIRQSVIEEQNRNAIDIWKEVTRSNYASIDRQERFHEFAVRLGSRREEFELTDGELNAACYLLLGLDLRLRDMDQRISYLSKAVDLGKRDLADQSEKLLHPGMSAEDFRRWSEACTNEALYHLAILFYNLGEYEQAVRKFEDAITFDGSDLGSMIYIPEARFLGHLVNEFEQIEKEFERIANLVQSGSLTHDWDQGKKDALLSQLSVRFGNCYYARSPYQNYAKHRKLSKALEHYKKAHQLYPTYYLAQFSYAQTLVAVSKQNAGIQRGAPSGQAAALFEKVFPSVRDKLASTIEPKIRMMLYYMLAICVKEGQIEGELPQAYLAQIHAEKGNLGTNPRVRIFSPRTKNDLTVADFIEEVRKYQSHLPTLRATAV